MKTTGHIGEGIFLVKDVAEILHLPLPKVRRWLIEFWESRFAPKDHRYSFGEPNNRAVNFFTLIEFITFAMLRDQGFSSQRIQKFHKMLAEEMNTPYPFAKTKLLTDKKKVWYTKFNELVCIDGKRQLSLIKILSPYLNKIDFDADTVALRYFPAGKKSTVVIDPKHQFGQPTIVGTNIKVETIYSLYQGKEPMDNICNLYDLTPKQVKDAVSYCRKLAA